MRRMSARLFLTWLILACAQTAAADSVDWAAGQQSFQKGDFNSALRHFEAAKNSGLEGPALHYNIAVCYFKLEQWAAARAAFRHIADRFPKLEGLAEYNLGLVARRVGDESAATAHFLRAYEKSPEDQTLRILASKRLRELAPVTVSPAAWHGAIGMQVGFDDNVALRDETGLAAGTTTDSPVAEFFGSVKGPLGRVSGAGVEAGLYIVRNFDADEFDQTQVYGGAAYDWQGDTWQANAGVQFGLGTLGGDAFDRKVGVHASATGFLGTDASLRVLLRHDDVSDADALYAGIAGSRQQIRVRYRWYSGSHRWTLRYRGESNDRADSGVSPDRNEIGFDYRYQPDAGWGYEGGIAARSSDYDDLPEPRSEDLTTAHVAMTRTLRDNWLLSLEIRYSDNDSSDPAFSYDRSQIAIGVVKPF